MANCTESKCSAGAIPRLYDGKSYCQEHYWQRLLGDFQMQYERWRIGTEPSERFISLKGRLVEERYWNCTNGLMSGGRLKDRSYSHKKTPVGFTFEITRHPGAWKNEVIGARIVETWEVNIEDRSIKKTGERPWNPGDSDL